MTPRSIILLIVLAVFITAIILFFIRNHKDKNAVIRQLIAEEEILLPEINEPKIDPSA
jgi:hypothetical protein